jgi:uncharacterized protein (TIGR00255 family)
MGAETRGASDRALRSMTGFGRSRRLSGQVEIVTEVRSVNHRFLDVTVKLPRMYASFEPEIRKIVAERVHRGKLDVIIIRTGGRGSVVEVVLDRPLAESYYACLVQMRELLGLAGDITVTDMLRLDDVIVPVEREAAVEQEWTELRASVEEGLSALDDMRQTEGDALWADVVPRLLSIRDQVDLIATEVHHVPAAAKERLLRRVQELTGGMELDENRLLQEVAFIADRADVTEELTRLKSHVEQFLAIGAQGSPLGRKLDFLLQELHREVNTVGSKSSSTTIASCVVNMKTELEKIREQIQNIE